MRVTILGAGAIGCYYGARLQQAGAAVAFVARGAQLRALRERGLRILSPAGDLQLESVQAVERPEQAGPADWVICGVKAWQVPEAAEALRSSLGPDTAVLPLQNGVEASDQLAAVLGARHVARGATWIAAQLLEPGVVRHAGIEPRIAMGERDGRATPRVAALAEALRRAGIVVELPEDMLQVLWSKLLFISAISGLSAATRLPVSEWRQVPETRRLLRAALEETAAVGRARGIALPGDVVDSTLAFIDSLPAGALPSMARDLLEGRPSELETQNGAVLRLGRELGQAAPTHEFLYGVLLPAERRARA